jgi:tRNA U34 5-methylaminomethyl-2-thiouridine-forming methyltransferase MnmC
MKREIIATSDGSHTVEIQEMKVTYHSRHGAIQESMHVFIEAGLHYMYEQVEPEVTLHVFEMGFGTGLNAFLTAIDATQNNRRIDYTAIEAFPLSTDEASVLNYTAILGYQELFEQLHQSKWNESIPVTNNFTLNKIHSDLISLSTSQRFHLIYYDAFAPAAQPELWTKEIFDKLYTLLLPGGVLVTYCSKGDVRRAMIAAGFQVEKLPGPPHKREMLRIKKIGYV